MSTGASVTRWTRYGHDRLYVNGADGTRLGWFDLKTGEQHIDVPEREAELLDALAAEGHPTTPAAVEDSASPVSAGDWTDLAQNRPGQGAREQADEKLVEQRSRSRLLSAVARAFDVKTDERAWRKGAEGEETVGARLEKLTAQGWHVLHSVPVGDRGSDIDHVLIGPGGVFTLNTKNHPGKRIWVSPTQIRVDGQVQPYLRNSRFEAERTSRLLTNAVGWDVDVRPALILLTGTLIPDVTIKSGGPTDVLILDRMDVPRVFRKAAARLSADQVAELFGHARRSSLWTAATP